ncbi:MAG: hypothetical protein ABIN69_17570, partial [Aestuariivirga sp.]
THRSATGHQRHSPLPQIQYPSTRRQTCNNLSLRLVQNIGQAKLARVLMADPSIILLDEPAAGVNPALLEFIIERVKSLNAQGTSILLIEHNMDMVTRLCHRVVVMAGGKYLTEGTSQAVARNPAVIEAYLGAVA